DRAGRGRAVSAIADRPHPGFRALRRLSRRRAAGGGRPRRAPQLGGSRARAPLLAGLARIARQGRARRAPAGDLGAAPTQGAHLRAALIPSTSCARSDVRPAEVRSRREPDQRALARIVRHLGDAPASVGIRRRLSLLETLVRERHAEVPRVEASGHVTHGLAVLAFRLRLNDEAPVPAPYG